MDIPIDLPPPPTVQETQVYTQPTTKHQLPAHIPPLPDIPTWQSQMEDDHYFDDENEDALSELSDDDEPESTGSLSAQNFFIHNGYRYDGDVYELRPPQERSIASRPQRILEHKPALLPNRQIFNRVYSEGTYNARPSSLRQPSNRSSARLSAGYASSEQADDEDSANMANKLNLDLPGCEPVPLPVTRPGSVRPAAPLSDTREALCDTIERVRQSAHATGDHKLQGLLAYSAVPVTRITGYKPTPPVASRSESKSVSLDPQGFATVGVDEFGGCDENVVPQIREKRGRSYASFAKSTPYASDVVKDSERKPFWKVLSR